MDSLLRDLANTIAPLLVQLLEALLLALASAALLKGRTWLDGKLTEQQRAFLQQLAETSVHLAEKEGAGKLGTEKAALAQQYVDRELSAARIDTVRFGDIEAVIIGAVQKAWSDQIGETYHRPADPATTVAQQPTSP